MTLRLVPTAPATRRDRLRLRLLLCIQAFAPDTELSPNDEALLTDVLGSKADQLILLCVVVEDEFRITIRAVDIVQIALNGPTMGQLLDLVEARTNA